MALVPATGQTDSVAAGDDGDLQKGVPWPDPRFTDNGDGTVTDHLTGLIWLVLLTFRGKEPFCPAWLVVKGTGDCPRGRASEPIEEQIRPSLRRRILHARLLSSGVKMQS